MWAKILGRQTHKRPSLRAEKIAGFLEAAYDFQSDDQTWLSRVMDTAKVVYERGRAMHGGIYDASDVAALRIQNIHVDGFPAEGVDWIMKGQKLITPAMVARAFRSMWVSRSSISLPEMLPMNEAMGSLGFVDTLYLNGLDPGGRGILLGLWTRERVETAPGELGVYRRMAQHLGAAYRLRRRLREAQADRRALDVTEGAAAVLDARKRIVHAAGSAETKKAQRELIESSEIRDRAWTTQPHAIEGLCRWRPLTSARWTLVDTFEQGGARYIVARENPSDFSGVNSLSPRERQVVAYAAIGQSTKETGYALGISDTTVRVLLSRAAAKLGVKHRAGLLEHPEVRALMPGTSLDAQAGPRRRTRQRGL